MFWVEFLLFYFEIFVCFLFKFSQIFGSDHFDGLKGGPISFVPKEDDQINWDRDERGSDPFQLANVFGDISTVTQKCYNVLCNLGHVGGCIVTDFFIVDRFVVNGLKFLV